MFLLLSAALGRYRLGLLRCWLGCERVDDGGGTKDADIGQGAVVLVGSHLLNLIDDIEALQDFTKDSILTIEVGCAALGLIDFYHLWCQLDAPFGERVEAVLDAPNTRVVHLAPPDDIELAGGRAHLRIDVIGLAGCG